MAASAWHRDQGRKGSHLPYLGHLLAVQQRFGEVVATIVAECSDSDPAGGIERSPENWPARKRAYIAELEHKSHDALLVSLADKLHNATSILTDLRSHHREDVWERFNAGKEDQLEYYQQLARAFLRLVPGRMADELVHVVAEIVRDA
jgi:(p)ppGpp synthase/HD superfamily hydrolase